MSLHLGSIAPDFEQESTQGPIRFYEWSGNHWVVFFSHPADFTPVCTTELIEGTQAARVRYPILADADRSVSSLYDLVHPELDPKLTVRSVYFIDPNKKIRASINYPPSTGRNFDEVLRLVDSLQLTDRHPVATPADWKQGDDVVIVPSLTDPEILRQRFPEGYRQLTRYLRIASQPRE